MINKNQVAQRFGKMSANYEKYAKVQKHMAYTLHHMASKTGTFKRILEIGCGTGIFTRLLAELYPQAKILATDISLGMLVTAQANLAEYSNITYAVEDGEALNTREHFDLIISNAAFQWFNDYQRALYGFYDRLNDGGHLLYATLGMKTFNELHSSFSAVSQKLCIKSKDKHGQTFVNAANLQEFADKAGFKYTSYKQEELKEYFSTVKEFLYSVKKIGANNASSSGESLVSRKLIFSMMRHYEQHFRDADKIYATYHVIYGAAQK